MKHKDTLLVLVIVALAPVVYWFVWMWKYFDVFDNANVNKKI